MLDFPKPPVPPGTIFGKWESDGEKWQCRCSFTPLEGGDMKQVIFKVYEQSGIHVPTPGMYASEVELIGCGGGGEPVTPNGSSYFCGRGAGAGAYMRFWLNAQQMGAQRPITICPGGLIGQFTDIQKRTVFGASWCGGGSDGNVNNGYGGFQGNFEGTNIGWASVISKAAGAVPPVDVLAPQQCFFQEGQSGFGGLCFLNQATPLPGQNGPFNQIVQLIGRGGTHHKGGSLTNHTIAPDPPGWDGSKGCGGSGAICGPTHPVGILIVGGKGGGGVVAVTEFIE